MKCLTALIASVGLLLMPGPMTAHHSFSSEFDANKPVLMAGKVTGIEWTMPHAMLHLNVTDEAGRSSNWTFELGSPEDLAKSGWNRDSLKTNTIVVVEGWRAKDNTKKLGNAKSVTIVGKQLDAHSSMAATPRKPANTQ